jgi:hypothetical protein
MTESQNTTSLRGFLPSPQESPGSGTAPWPVNYEDNDPPAIEALLHADTVFIGLGWSSGDVPMSLLEQQHRRSFGVDDRPICPQCGDSMHLSGRAPHPEHGANYERQTFICYGCRYESLRSADASGNPYN